MSEETKRRRTELAMARTFLAETLDEALTSSAVVEAIERLVLAVLKNQAPLDA